MSPPSQTYLHKELCKAVDRGDVLRVKSVLQFGARRLVGANKRFRSCMLHVAAGLSSPSICKVLLHAGASPNELCCERCCARKPTPLHCAVSHGAVQTVQLLLRAGADVHAVDHAGCSPLWYLHVRQLNYNLDHPPAANGTRKPKHQEFTKILQLLLAAGADINFKKTKRTQTCNVGTTLLHLAVDRGDVTMVQQLLNNGADSTLADAQGVTPLHLTRDCFPVVKAFIVQHTVWATSLRRQWLLRCLQK